MQLGVIGSAPVFTLGPLIAVEPVVQGGRLKAVLAGGPQSLGAVFVSEQPNSNDSLEIGDRILQVNERSVLKLDYQDVMDLVSISPQQPPTILVQRLGKSQWRKFASAAASVRNRSDSTNSWDLPASNRSGRKASAVPAIRSDSDVKPPPEDLPTHAEAPEREASSDSSRDGLRRQLVLDRQDNGCFGFTIIGQSDADVSPNESMEEEENCGVFVFTAEQPVIEAGLKRYDRLLSIDGMDVTTASFEDAMSLLQHAGESTRLEVLQEADAARQVSDLCRHQPIGPARSLNYDVDSFDDLQMELLANPKAPSHVFVARIGNNGPVADDEGHGRIKSGDQVLSINGVDVKRATMSKFCDLRSI